MEDSKGEVRGTVAGGRGDEREQGGNTMKEGKGKRGRGERGGGVGGEGRGTGASGQ